MKIKLGCYWLCLFFISCSHSVDLQELKKNVISFDNDNSSVIHSLIDSLKKVDIDWRKNLVMDYSVKTGKVGFYYSDSDSRSAYLNVSNFKLTNVQEDFLLKGRIAFLRYDRHFDVYYMKLFLFKEGDEAVWLYVNYDSNKKSILKNDRELYTKQERLYTIGEAW